jgi:hypothetical protein
MTSILLGILSRVEWVGIDLTFHRIDVGHVASPCLGRLKDRTLYRDCQLLVPWSVIISEVLQVFKKKSKFLKWYSRITQCIWFPTKALVCLLLQPTPNKLICGGVGRKNMWHICFSCVVESKTRSLEATSHTTWSRCACVCIYGGWRMDSF